MVLHVQDRHGERGVAPGRRRPPRPGRAGRQFRPTYATRSGHDQPRVRHLLDHTAGAPNPFPLRWIIPADRSPDEAGEILSKVLHRARPRRTPGPPARYSNLSYLLLAEVVSQVAGEPFEQFVRRAILQPAGMHATDYAYHRDGAYATGYVRLPRPLTPLLRAALPSGIVGDRHGSHVALHRFRVVGAGYGGLIGTALDAARLLRLHLADGVIDGQRILNATTTRAMRDIRTRGKPSDLGLGWFRQPTDRDAHPRFVEHWGTGGGYRNAMRLYPDIDVGIVIMANTTQAYNHDAIMTAAIRALNRP